MSELLKADAVRGCFDSAIPATLVTADANGVPNIAYLSQVQFIDSDHIALSYQFFNKTRQNLLVNPQAQLLVLDPQTVARYSLSLQYLRTETSGPVFENMKAKLAGIASHTGMSGVFKLLGADIFKVHAIVCEPGETVAAPPKRNHLAALRACTGRLAACADLEQLLTETLACLGDHMDISHSMLLMYDEPRAMLYTVASRGYDASGVGAEIPLGQGVIGVAARERSPIRIGHMSAEYAYSRAIRDNAKSQGWAAELDTEIPMPGLPESRSQLAVPILGCQQRLIGMLYVEGPQNLRFTYDDEDVLVALAAQLGLTMHVLQNLPENADAAPIPEQPPDTPQGPVVAVRRFMANDSVFLNDDYLIKGVAGSILWNLLRDYVDKNRTVFTNRELRLDSRISLPDLSDNLEARLLLLSRRLVERQACVRIEKTGRGRFQLQVTRPIELIEIAG